MTYKFVYQVFFISTLFLFSFSVRSQGYGSIKGKLIDETGEPAVYTKVVLKETNLGALTNIEGEYLINNIPPGNYTILISSLEFQETVIKDVVIQADKITFLDKTIVMYQQIETLKPIIYLYPEDTTDITIKLDYEGQLTTTYPRYKDQWMVTATPESTLIDSTGRSYYSFYWEGVPANPLTIKEGTVVAKAETISFLEESLALLGLSEREANEFIIYWLPVLEKSEFNVISFSTREYETQAKLNIQPTPDEIIRVMMVYRGLDAPIKVKQQDLEPLKKSRKGFTVVEWGGQEAKSFDVN